MARPLVGAATVYFLLNTGLIATAIALSSQRAHHDDVAHQLPVERAELFRRRRHRGAGAVWLIEHAGYWVAPLTFAPVYLMYRTYKVYMGRIEDEQRHVQQTSDLHLATIEALARAIDAKDQTTQSHIRRVQLYAAGLAKAAGLGPAEIQGVKTAALLHDIGKLAVPEHILSKPGPLTQEEFQKIRIHPQVGAEIIAAVPFPYPVAPLILSHHERWDGKGYPQGLAGEDIPIGARILTIVDYYDAVTTERPYHKALSHDSAIGLLRHEAGRALDPRLASTFIELLPALIAEADAAELDAEAAAAGRPWRPVRPPSGLLHGDGHQRVREHRARAPRNLRALRDRPVDGHQPRRLRHDGADLVEADEDRAVVGLRAVPACSPTADAEVPLRGRRRRAEALLNTTLAVGQGLAGWVARNRRTLVNADPRVDVRGARASRPTRPPFGDRLPAVRQRYVHRLPGAVSHAAEPLHRRSPPAARARRRAGGRRHPQLDRLRADAGRFADRSADRRCRTAARCSRTCRASWSRAERLDSELGADRHGHRRVQGDQRHLRPPRRRPRAARRWPTTLQSALRPYDLCVRYAGDEFIVVLAECSREAAEAKRRELQERVGEIQIEVRAGKMLRLAASAGAAVFPHDGTSYEALLAEADHRMYRDKAARRGRRQRSARRRGPSSCSRRVYEPGQLDACRVASAFRRTSTLQRTSRLRPTGARERLSAVCLTRPTSSSGG